MAGFNFRAGASSVIDGIDETYVDAVSLYPTVRNGFTFGWVSPVSLAGRTRDTAIDRRLTGQNQTNNSDGYLLFVANSGAGTFNITLALGEASFGSGPIFAEIVEVNNSQVVQSILSTVVSNQSNGAAQWYDSSGVNRIGVADWVNNNSTIQVTVASGNSLGIRLGDPAGIASGQSKISHFAYEAAAPSASITNVNTTNEVTDGQQNVSVIVSGFAGDITSMSLRVGADTLALTGLTGSGDNYTIDFPDISAFVSDTVGLPFSSPAYQVELLASDGTDTAAIDITLEPKAGWEVVETVSAVDTEGSIFETRTGGAPFDGSQIYYPNAGNTTISATGIIQTDLNTMSGVLWDVTSKTWETFTVNINVVNDTNYVKPIVNSIVRPIVNSIINHKV